MKFFYADSLDLVDPHFDFETETSRNPRRVPQRDDVYAHELLAPERPYDGLLVSKSLFRVGGGSVASGKYSQPQRKRFEREGAPRFLRFPSSGEHDPEAWPIMGDCGAFAYRNEDVPPYSIDEIIEFYDVGQFTHGISLDHVVLAYDASLDAEGPAQGALPGFSAMHSEIKAEARRRQQISIENASVFFESARSQGVDFVPVGAAHGWSPASYRESVRALMKMGYDYIALGGLVPRRNDEIAEVLEAVREETTAQVRLHLLGVVRSGLYDLMRACGVASFDSSSPVWQAFKDARDNYYSTDENGHYTAVRIPQANLGLPMRLIKAGKLDQATTVQAEKAALEALRAYGAHKMDLGTLMGVLRTYDDMLGNNRKTRTPWDRMQRTLSDRPWESCPCPVCRDLGVEVILFRGANRNRRRGFHNLWWTQRQLEQWRGDQA